jgi:hypothetical protein
MTLDPDDEMLRIEAELERKAREANSTNVQQKIVVAKSQVNDLAYSRKLTEGATTLSITTFSIITLSIKGIFAIFSI